MTETITALAFIAFVWTSSWLMMLAVYFGRLIARQKQQLQERNEMLEYSQSILQQAADVGRHTAEICHDMNHFLQSRQLYSELLQDKKWDEQYLDSLEFSNQNLLRLSREVQTLLQPANANPSRHHRLQPLLQSAFQTAVTITGLQSTAWQSQVDEDTLFEFDDSLPDVLNNILINALQAMNKTESPWLKIWVQQGTLHIQDGGSGIPSTDMEKLFSMHYSSRGKTIGLGMGSIARRCKQNNRQLNIISNSEGSTVSISAQQK